MRFEEGHIYHIYNVGNNSVQLFFNRENYIFFLQKIRKEIKPISEILSYCLMPNHFHFMVMATSQSCENNKQGVQLLSRKIGTLLSSYSQAINKQQNTSGSLFRQKTKAKDLREYIHFPRIKNDYVDVCFSYIHNNPVNAKIVAKPEDWEFSSSRDFCGLRNGTLSNKKLIFEILNINEISFLSFMKEHNKNFDNIW